MAPKKPGTPAGRAQVARPDPDGEFAKLFDTIRPASFDADEDGLLAADEFARALFSALDLDGDRALSFDELSRLPGETRELRFRSAAARALEKTLDKGGDGRVGPKEFRGAASVLAALDLDGDGAIAFTAGADARRGNVAQRRMLEWPERQSSRIPLPPVVTRATLLARFDTDKDGVLSTRELRARPDLVAHGDRTGDGRIEAHELQIDLDRIAGDGVDVTVDGFLERWDLDHDGEVSRAELSLAIRR